MAGNNFLYKHKK